MKKQRATEEQIIAVLKEQDAGTPVSELCRRHGVSDTSIYKWKAELPAIRRLVDQRPTYG
ncbi:UNVERIFIED_ORG: transposase-like protein [Rhizobium sp. SORGH_AS260]|nr:transposase-like protein [Rhizobium sp. SORGH_AS_0285]MDP9755886.1 transposase-like protein [Rhizobium sp. SORGH_AS_0260]MDR6081454.1 transposase-like protein [Agrobacterium sp. SORGH_AS_0440]